MQTHRVNYEVRREQMLGYVIVTRAQRCSLKEIIAKVISKRPAVCKEQQSKRCSYTSRQINKRFVSRERGSPPRCLNNLDKIMFRLCL